MKSTNELVLGYYDARTKLVKILRRLNNSLKLNRTYSEYTKYSARKQVIIKELRKMDKILSRGKQDE